MTHFAQKTAACSGQKQFKAPWFNTHPLVEIQEREHGYSCLHWLYATCPQIATALTSILLGAVPSSLCQMQSATTEVPLLRTLHELSELGVLASQVSAASVLAESSSASFISSQGAAGAALSQVLSVML